MDITATTVHKIAHLARLELSEQEETNMATDLGKIIAWMEQLNEVDTTGVTPLTHLSEGVNVFREDVAENRLTRADALKNAPKSNENYFIVPKVME